MPICPPQSPRAHRSRNQRSAPNPRCSTKASRKRRGVGTTRAEWRPRSSDTKASCPPMSDSSRPTYPAGAGRRCTLTTMGDLSYSRRRTTSGIRVRRTDQDLSQGISACEVLNLPNGGAGHSASLVSGHANRDTELGGWVARSTRHGQQHAIDQRSNAGQATVEVRLVVGGTSDSVFSDRRNEPAKC